MYVAWSIESFFVSRIVQNKMIPESCSEEVNQKISFMNKINNFIFC